MSVDILAIGAHPDDIEMTIGGTLAKLRDRGRSLAIADLTRGEMATRGTPETRAEEAAAAADALGAVERTNLDLGDGWLQDTMEARTRVIELIRRVQPTIVFANYWDDVHPDHRATGEIVRNVMYPVGFANFPAQGPPCRPREFLFFMQHWPFNPSFIIDISESFHRKMEAVRCYQSQLHNPASPEPATWISHPELLQFLEGRARHFGMLIRRPYGEPVITGWPVPMDDPVAHYEPFPK